MASLYVGSDIGSTYVAAAAGCPTMVIYGPTDPAVKAPRMINSRIQTLWRPYEGEFSWAKGATVEEATAAVDALLQEDKPA
jgi:ADP-heptose:LPS heptosyltransferase